MTPEEVRRYAKRFKEVKDSFNHPFQPSPFDDIQGKTQSGKNEVDRDKNPWWYNALVVIGMPLFWLMLIVSFVRSLIRKSEPTGPARDEARLANAHAVEAAAKYRKLARLVNRKNFVRQRAALATEGAAAETAFRQAAESYQAAAATCEEAVVTGKPTEQTQARMLAKAYGARRKSNIAMADMVALLGDATVTTVEEFTRRAAPLLAAAKTANVNWGRLMKGKG